MAGWFHFNLQISPASSVLPSLSVTVSQLLRTRVLSLGSPWLIQHNLPISRSHNINHSLKIPLIFRSFFVLCKFPGNRRTHSTPGLFETEVIRKRLKRLDCLIEENVKLKNAGFPPSHLASSSSPFGLRRNVSRATGLSYQLINRSTN